MSPIGYTYLNQFYKLLLPKLNVEVFADKSVSADSIVDFGSSKRRVIPATRKITDSPYEHMCAAIKYQGIRLHFFAAIFKVIDVNEFADFIRASPQSKYNRVLWFLFEWLTDAELPIPALTSGNYITLFDDAFYYTLKDGIRHKRMRVINNAIGNRDYCPTVRKTKQIQKIAGIDVYETAYTKMQSLGDVLSTDILGRSINYLYSKETKSSTEIENERPDKQRMQRFLNAVKNVGLFELNKGKLIDIQNQIVEERVRANDYRTDEIYVGSTIQRYNIVDEDVHYIGPLAKHVPGMMAGLLATHENLMLDRSMPALIHACIISFGEVYIHPFIDGNGRLHRYLIHDVMKQREAKHKFIIPVSAAILRNPEKYDQVLESISRPILSMLDYSFSDDSKIVINNDIEYMYRYPDFTEHVKFVYDMMETAVSSELIEEVCLIICFDTLKDHINSTFDISNKNIDVLISLLLSNGGTLSKSKQSYVQQFIELKHLPGIETAAKGIIEKIFSQFSVNIPELMNRK
ncbi:Fic family protein [Rheinheimera sp. UJ51]|uniref:Fic family protein n=3 Tax=unclassified Rheinheimera TaxID=115860 RepID=UPI001E58E351|nr:Fic family protein [Rheinheimera sp. UJ51]MCC5453292.1 Fic family protein [Rheinheimera sp. UJ51]